MSDRSDPAPAALERFDAARLNQASQGKLPGLFGIEVVAASSGLIESTMAIRQEFLAPNGYLHAATVVALADTSCGYGTLASLPEGAVGFTTIELKSNHLGTAREGVLACTARLTHGGRRTQVWDAEVRDAASGTIIALFRCTQMLIYDRRDCDLASPLRDG